MATARQNLTPIAIQTPAVVNIRAKELSGSQWEPRFPTSTSVSDLAPSFKANVEKFIASIAAAGGSVSIAATYRPKERAYLMHYSSRISRGDIAAASVPAMEGVNINWVHSTTEESKKAATAMATGYGIVFPPALESRHTERTAIDMSISGVINKKLKNADGVEVKIKKTSDLHAVGDTFGVVKLVSDPPHWSIDGH